MLDVPYRIFVDLILLSHFPSLTPICSLNFVYVILLFCLFIFQNTVY